jgi:hypothetical protein
MAWEWRYFQPMPAPDDGPLPLQGKREDVYFPAGNDMGMKLRNGSGELEVKSRTQCSNANGKLPSPAEYWVKTIHSDCLDTHSQEPQVDSAACARALGRPAHQLFDKGAGQPLPVRVLCRKSRRHTKHGEEVDCLFIATVNGQNGRHSLIERFRSVSVEGSLESVAAVVCSMGPVPENAIVGGYPTIVQDIAQRALDATRMTLPEAAHVEPTPEAVPVDPMTQSLPKAP